MINLIRADLYKMWKSPGIKVLLGLTAIAAVIVTGMAHMIQAGKIGTAAAGIAFLFSDASMLSVLGGVMAGILICGDYENKTIHQAAASGCSRGKIVVSKALSLFCAEFVLILPYVLASIIAIYSGARFSMGQNALGFLHVITSEAGKTPGAGAALRLVGILLTLIIVYTAQLSICIPLAFLLNRPILVVAIYYMFSVLCGQLILVSEQYAWFQKIFQCTPYSGEYYMIDLSVSGRILGRAVLVSSLYMILMIVITYTGFRKKDVK